MKLFLHPGNGCSTLEDLLPSEPESSGLNDGSWNVKPIRGNVLEKVVVYVECGEHGQWGLLQKAKENLPVAASHHCCFCPRLWGNDLV